MADIKDILSKYVCKRKLQAGEFSYVFKPTGESVSGKKNIWKMVKGNDDVYNKIKKEAALDDENDSQFDARALKAFPSVQFENLAEDKTETMDDEAEDEKSGGPKSFVTWDELFRKVSVGRFPTHKSNAEIETFLLQFDDVQSTKRHVYRSKDGKQKYDGTYSITFKSNEGASKFLLDEVKYEETVLKTVMMRSVMQERSLSRMHAGAFTHFKRVLEVIVPEDEEEKSVLVQGIGGPHPEEDIQEYFCGLESEYENITKVSFVYFHQSNKKKFIGYLVQFEDEENTKKFLNKRSKKFKSKDLMCQLISDALHRSKLYRQKINFNDLEDYNETDFNRQLVILRINEVDQASAEAKIKEVYQNVVNVHISKENSTMERIAVVTFESADSAQAALMTPLKIDVIRPINVLKMEEYLELRKKIIEEDKARLSRMDLRYKDIKENHVKIENNTIVVTDPSEPPEKKKKESKALTKGNKHCSVQTDSTVQGALAKRRNRGPSEWDEYVVVGGLHPKNTNLGKPNDMDICNYFLHNHKDVKDVKFVDWADAVFVRFNNIPAAEQFLGLSYAMFYGNEITRNDVETYLKKKNPKQKDEVARMLLGKQFNQVSKSNGATKTASGSVEVELSTFSSKPANLRSMFISELHLSDNDVGQTSWIKKDKKFTARLPVKLEENAIGYLVRKWNDMQINVAGETVSAQLATPSKGIKREAIQNKPSKPAKNVKKQKFNTYENY